MRALTCLNENSTNHVKRSKTSIEITCFANPGSTTYTIPSIVNDVSAMLVAITTLRAPGGVGSNILDCISVHSDNVIIGVTFFYFYKSKFHKQNNGKVC